MYDKYCKSCKTKLSDFYETGMLGCPDCYKAFRLEIVSALKNVQGGRAHKGKTPLVDGLDKQLISEYYNLIAEKERAGMEGRFSDMASITSLLAELTEELKNRGLL